MVGFDGLPSILDPEQLGHVLGLFNEALTHDQLMNPLVGRFSFITTRNGPFIGTITSRFMPSPSGTALEIDADVRNVEDPNFDQTLLEGFFFVARQGARILAQEQLVAHVGPLPAMASVVLNLVALKPDQKTHLYIADDDRYCWDHVHCAGCGLQSPGQDATGWERPPEAGPAGLMVAFCPACLDGEAVFDYPGGMAYYCTFGVPAHPVHTSQQLL